MVPYFDSLGFPCPQHTNPADHVIDLVNTDFMQDSKAGVERIDKLAAAWTTASEPYRSEPAKSETPHDQDNYVIAEAGLGVLGTIKKLVQQTFILVERNILNYSRNLLAYGVRLGMYRESIPLAAECLNKLSWYLLSRNGYSSGDGMVQARV